MDENKNANTEQSDETEFYKQVADLLIAARKHAKRQIDNTIAVTYYEIGRMIVEREQQGQKRARYGSKLIKGLSEYLTDCIGKGFSVVNLQSMRKFYQVYSPSIQQSVTAKLGNGKPQATLPEKSELLIRVFDCELQIQQSLIAKFVLSWTHYQVLMRIENEQARRFYEIEAAKLQWTVRELSRQVGSSLYERLALSRDKEKVMELAKVGQLVENPRDIFKSPFDQTKSVIELPVLLTRRTYMDEKIRCFGDSEIYIDYHDNEWGRPVHDDNRLFEMLILEGAQAGLSWITVLKKREAYREAFDGFDPRKVAAYGDAKVEALMANAGIIRNRLKINAAIINAKLFLQIIEQHGRFDDFIWCYVNHEPIVGHWERFEDMPLTTDISDRISKDLKKMGFKFVGSTIIYSFMQAVGMVNDHLKSCCVFDGIVNGGKG